MSFAFGFFVLVVILLFIGVFILERNFCSECGGGRVGREVGRIGVVGSRRNFWGC